MEIDPELARKALAADLRNIIKKLSDERTCTASERAMLQRLALPPGIPNQARVLSLFKRWAAGGRLSADELAEISAFHDTLIAQTNGSSEPIVPTSPPLSLAPDGPRIAGSRVKYPDKLSHYEALYDTDERSLKRYVKKGRSANPPDLPPFHRPVEMPEWWARRMHNRCPAGILNAAEKARKAIASEPAPAQEQQPTTAADAPSRPAAVQRDFSDIQTLDIAANVEQLRRSLAIIERQLEEARRGEIVDGKLVIDDGAISSRQRDYRETFAELRKAENDLLEWKEKMGELVLRDEVRAENNRIAAAIYRAVVQLVKTVRPQISGKSEPEQDGIWRAEVLACFAALKTANFTTFEPT